MRSRATAGRTTVFAGATLLAALALSAFVQPGSLLLSLAATVGVATDPQRPRRRRRRCPACSPCSASGSTPAAIGRARAGPRAPGSRRSPPRALRRPGLAAILIAVPLLLLAAPALGLSTAAPGIDELPSSNQARQSAEAIDAAVGPGWEAPFVLVAAAREGPITTPERLALLGRWQRRIAAQPGIRAVIGPGRDRARAPSRCANSGKTFTANGPGRHRRASPGSAPACAAPPTRSPNCAAASPRAPRAAACSAQGAERAQRGRRPARRRPRTRRRRGGEQASGAIDRLGDGLEAARRRPAQDRGRQPRPGARPAHRCCRRSGATPSRAPARPRRRSSPKPQRRTPRCCRRRERSADAGPGDRLGPRRSPGACATSPTRVNSGLNQPGRRRARSSKTGSGSSQAPRKG